MSNQLPKSYWSLLRQRFLENRNARWSVRGLLLAVCLAVFGNFIAGEVPIYCQLDNQSYFPVFKKYAVDIGLATWSPPFHTNNWRSFDYQQVIYPLIPYAAYTTDRKNRHYKSPFDKQEVASTQFHHWLGTDSLGHDVAAGMISGLQTALLVGILSMLLASLIGLCLGGLAGYFGDEEFQSTIARLIFTSIGVFLGIHFGFIARSYAISEGAFIIEIGKGLGILVIVLFIFNRVAVVMERLPLLSKKILLPIDLLVMRVVEVINGVPALLLILAISAVIDHPSIYTLILIIGIVAWTGIAKFVRAELLKIRTLDYVQAAKAMGFSHTRIFLKHALPKALGPVLITIAFGVAGAILAEATLSYLGIGLGGQITWGSLLKDARNQPGAWWLAVFPGLAIFFTVLIFNMIGEGLKEAVDGR